MAKKDPKPVLGYRHCPDCDTRATVHQAGGTRGTLYQRCECGADQRNGRMVQSMLWYQTDWLLGLQPDPAPAAVYGPEEYREKLAALAARHAGKAGPDTGAGRASAEAQENTGAALEDDPGADYVPAEAEPAGQQDAGKKRSPWGWILALLALLGGGIAYAAKVSKGAA